MRRSFPWMEIILVGLLIATFLYVKDEVFSSTTILDYKYKEFKGPAQGMYRFEDKEVICYGRVGSISCDKKDHIDQDADEADNDYALK